MYLISWLLVLVLINGFVEVDFKVPDELYDKFSEISPIFKNIVIDSSKKDIIGDHILIIARVIIYIT